MFSIELERRNIRWKHSASLSSAGFSMWDGKFVSIRTDPSVPQENFTLKEFLQSHQFVLLQQFVSSIFPNISSVRTVEYFPFYFNFVDFLLILSSLFLCLAAAFRRMCDTFVDLFARSMVRQPSSCGLEFPLIHMILSSAIPFLLCCSWRNELPR